MFRCTECGHLFEDGEQKTISEQMGEFWGDPAYQEWSVCPLCNGVYEEVEPCKICGGFETLESGEEVCENCKNEVLKRFRDLMCYNFTTEERELLNELLNGEEI